MNTREKLKTECERIARHWQRKFYHEDHDPDCGTRAHECETCKQLSDKVMPYVVTAAHYYKINPKAKVCDYRYKRTSHIDIVIYEAAKKICARFLTRAKGQYLGV